MNKWIRRLLIPALTMTIALPAMANPGTDRIYERIDRQQARIERGIDKGELTRREAGALRGKLRETRDMARSFRHRGMSPHEFRVLDRRLDHSDQLIRRFTSNGEVSYRGDNRHSGYGRNH